MRLTNPLDIAPADQRAPELEKRLMDVLPPLVANLQPPVAIQPRERPFHYPPVASQPFTRLDAPPGDAWSYAPLPERLAAAGEVVALVGVQLFGALARRPRRGLRIGSIASTASSKTFESWTLAAEWVTASGTPRLSTTTWRFEPDLPLSVGFGPVLWPPREQVRLPSPKKPSPSRSGPLLPNGPRASNAAAPTRPPRGAIP
jgi:hypothetical protein